MVPFNVLIFVCLFYVAFLFLVAFAAEQRARAGHHGWLRSPLVYTLSLSVYCTAWTFYGAVGYAARSGLEFVTIYLGPTLVMVASNAHRRNSGYMTPIPVDHELYGGGDYFTPIPDAADYENTTEQEEHLQFRL